MKILKRSDGPLTNFEVLDFLRSRGAKSDPMSCIGAVAPSECKVFDYLVNSPSCNQTRKDIVEFVKRFEAFDLAQAEKLNIMNLRPSNQAQIFPIIESCDKRFVSDGDDSKVEEIVQLVLEILPAPPEPAPEPEEEEEASDNVEVLPAAPESAEEAPNKDVENKDVE